MYERSAAFSQTQDVPRNSASKSADQIDTVRVGGYSVKVMEGVLLL